MCLLKALAIFNFTSEVQNNLYVYLNLQFAGNCYSRFKIDPPPPTVGIREAKYLEFWHNMTSAWASWRGFDVPIGGHSV